MSLTIATETLNSQIPFGQIGNVISSPKVFQKKSLEQIADTEISLCNISFSDFVNVFSFEIVNIVGDEFSEQIIFKLEYANKFFVQLRLNGYWELGKEPKFQLIDVDWNFEEKENNPTSAFLLETFKAILFLSKKVKVEIPSINYNFENSFSSLLNNISEILQTRQIAYRLMVIEKAFQTSLPFPLRSIEGKEVENAAFCYHAIIEREFDWLCDSLTVSPPSKTKNIDLLPPTNKPFPLTFKTSDEKRIIFGKEINLGQFFIEINQAVVVNYKEARKNLIALNGKPVEVIIKSVNGKMKYKATKNIPTLPKNAFAKDIQKLIDLDEKFTSIFMAKYFDLAGATLDGLTEVQIEAITQRPTLEEEAFDF